MVCASGGPRARARVCCERGGSGRATRPSQLPRDRYRPEPASVGQSRCQQLLAQPHAVALCGGRRTPGSGILKCHSLHPVVAVPAPLPAAPACANGNRRARPCECVASARGRRRQPVRGNRPTWRARTSAPPHHSPSLIARTVLPAGAATGTWPACGCGWAHTAGTRRTADPGEPGSPCQL